MVNRLRLLTALVAFGCLIPACSQNSSEAPSAASKEVAAGGPVMTPAEIEAIHGGTISGTISIRPQLSRKLAGTDVLYIIARRADSQGPPVAVQQVKNITFPFEYTLTSADAMMPGSLLQGRVNVVVRLDRDGAAGPPQPGDMEGTYSRNPATVGDRGVDIEIDREF